MASALSTGDFFFPIQMLYRCGFEDDIALIAGKKKMKEQDEVIRNFNVLDCFKAGK